MLDISDRPLLPYLCEQSREYLQKLYSSPAAALVVFRTLPTLSQHFILKSLWLGKTSLSSWQSLVSKEHVSAVKDHVDLLRRLAILTDDDGVSLDRSFRRAYLTAIRIGFYGASELKIVTEMDEKSRKVASKDLGKKATERWECVLHYLALPSQKSEQGVSGATKQLFKTAGFTSGDEGEMEITSTGFQFLLLNRAEQIWSYLLNYFRMESSLNKDVLSQMEFLFRLMLCVDDTQLSSKSGLADNRSTTPVFRAFVIDDDWSQVVKDFLIHLRELGLVFIRKRKDGYFFITPLFNRLIASTSSSDTSSELNRSGYIIVETNFRVYAYTDSSLQLAILSTFTEMLYRFNDMSVGVLTRDSVRRALQVGITASQIVSFLRSNAHPKTILAANESGGTLQCVPITVADQIHLWEDERHRLTFTDAVIYSTFESEREYIGVKEYANSEGILLWYDNVQRLVVVTERGHDKVKAWWKVNKANVA